MMVNPDRTLVHFYGADGSDQGSAWVEGDDHEVMRAMTRMVGNGMVVVLEEAGVM